jgi:hypothetical protein
MRRALALTCVATLAVAVSGCTSDKPPVSDSCTASTDAIEQALGRAPARVTLRDGTPLSACIHDAENDADLQSVGIVFSQAAERLRVRAQAGDLRAAAGVGYVAGAVRRGAHGTMGVAAELQRRVELVAGRLEDDAPPRVDAAVERGLRAGEQHG